jgi:hypothetical protein
MELKKQIRNKIVETKEIKDKKIIEESLVISRILMVVESADKVKNYKSLSIKERIDLSVDLLDEIATLQEQGLINEQEGLGGMLSKIFGSAWSGLVQTLVEPLVNSILSGLGMNNGFFKNTLVSFFTKSPGRLAKALRGDCKELTGLVVESFIEGIVMKLQDDKGMNSGGWVFLRNALGDGIRSTDFIRSLESSMESTICELFGKLTGKASEVVDKLKSQTQLAVAPKS